MTKAKIPVSIRQLFQMFSDGDLPEKNKNTIRLLKWHGTILSAGLSCVGFGLNVYVSKTKLQTVCWHVDEKNTYTIHL